MAEEIVAVPTEAAAVITYSNIMYPAGQDASRPSRLAFLASGQALGAEPNADQPPQLLIAGEQSQPGRPTTGEIAVEHYSHLLPRGFEATALPPDKNRLINTARQVAALVERCHELEARRLKVVGWGFHLPRVVRLFRAHDPDIALQLYPVEAAIMAMPEATRNIHLVDFGFDLDVDFQTILRRGMAQFAQREARTQLALLPAPKGGLLNALSLARRNRGRLDDLDPQGWAITGTTRLPLHVEQALPVLTELEIQDSETEAMPSATID